MRDENLGFGYSPPAPRKSSKSQSILIFFRSRYEASDNNVDTEARNISSAKTRPARSNGSSGERQEEQEWLLILPGRQREPSLFTRIGEEEEPLKGNLRFAHQTVHDDILKLEEQRKGIDEGADVGTVKNRMNEIRTNLTSVGNKLREALSGLWEHHAGDGGQSHYQAREVAVRDKIIYPLSRQHRERRQGRAAPL